MALFICKALCSPFHVSRRAPILLVVLTLFLFLDRAATHTSLGHHTANPYRAASSNSCTVTWGQPASKPTLVFAAPLTHHGMLPSTLAEDPSEDDLELDEEQYEVRRLDRIHKAIQWAECLANDWPELDLQWCLADWHEGKLIPDTEQIFSDTCWRCVLNGWLAPESDNTGDDPATEAPPSFDASTTFLVWLFLSGYPLSLFLHIRIYTTARLVSFQELKDFCQSCVVRFRTVRHVVLITSPCWILETLVEWREWLSGKLRHSKAHAV